MSEPLKNPDQQPESYDPRTPEIVSMVEGAQAPQGAKAAHAPVLPEHAEIDFRIPFTNYSTLWEANCWASLYMHLENIPFSNDYVCAKNTGADCTDCGNCRQSAGGIQEELYFIFHTMSGNSAHRKPYNESQHFWDGYELHKDDLEFMAGYAGYQIEIFTDDRLRRIQSAILADKPVIVRIRPESEPTELHRGLHRVITGYRGDQLIMPNTANAQTRKMPYATPSISDIEALYIFTKADRRKYSLLDGLRRIRRVMESNFDNGVYESFIEKFVETGDANHKEMKRRFQAAENASWHNLNAHNFSETFRHRYWDELKDARFTPMIEKIDVACVDIQDRCGQICALNQDYKGRKKRPSSDKWGCGWSSEWAFCRSIVDCFNAIKADDMVVLGAVNEMIMILEEGTK